MWCLSVDPAAGLPSSPGWPLMSTVCRLAGCHLYWPHPLLQHSGLGRGWVPFQTLLMGTNLFCSWTYHLHLRLWTFRTKWDKRLFLWGQIDGTVIYSANKFPSGVGHQLNKYIVCHGQFVLGSGSWARLTNICCDILIRIYLK